MTSQERFDLQQMKKAGVAGIAFADDNDDLSVEDEPSSESEIEDIEIEVHPIASLNTSPHFTHSS